MLADITESLKGIFCADLFAVIASRSTHIGHKLWLFMKINSDFKDKTKYLDEWILFMIYQTGDLKILMSLQDSSKCQKNKRFTLIIFQLSGTNHGPTGCLMSDV